METGVSMGSPLWSGFHKKSLAARKGLLREAHPAIDHSLLGFSDEEDNAPSASSSSSESEAVVLSPPSPTSSVSRRRRVVRRHSLPSIVADSMVENCIGALPLPLGLGLNLTVNGKEYQVPMVVEEPSVIAAVSGAGKTISSSGGFTASTTSDNGGLMTGQVQLLDIKDCSSTKQDIEAQREELIGFANAMIPNMVARGGGVKKLEVRIITPRSTPQPPFIVVHIGICVKDAMGANVVNTVCEGVKAHLAATVGGRPGLGILSNLCDERTVEASFSISADKLKWHTYSGETLAQRIVEAYWFAVEDPYRATTHNKGVLNGIDAVAVATGQDWRAIEAGAHAYASRSGSYKPLTSYTLEDGILHGHICLPMAVGTCGGSLRSHPMYAYTHRLVGNPSTTELAQIIAAVGLAQNFAALRALATEGIQKGHMALHARNVAIAANTPVDKMEEVARYLAGLSPKLIKVETARAYINSS